jgi:WD40 repeat protein
MPGEPLFTPTGPNDQTLRLVGDPLPPPPSDISATIHDSTPIPPRWPDVPGYVITGELGRGGMGVVYRARQDRLNRTVAVKMLLKEQFADVSDVVRFRSEAEAVAAVTHPHVVKVYESGQHAGRPYFVMEYLSGGTLHAKLRTSAPLPPDAAAGVVEKLAWAVHAAHQQGIIHRDLKPGNVLFDADGEPRVTDFGLAKRSSQELTKTQVVMGTPAYMPPEQAAGRAKYAGPPADIYALGVILYEALTGHTPFSEIDSVVMLARVISEPPVSPRSKVAGIPHDLELICLKCLEKEPGDRYPTAAALGDDLRRFLNREPVSIRPAGPIEKAVKWARRRPTLASAYALGAAAAGLLLFGGGVSALWLQAEHARRTADESATQADSARHEANANWQLAEQAGGELARRNGELGETLGRERAAKAEAEKARREAEAARADLQRLAYFRDVGLAHSEATAGNVLRARQLLDACPPAARGWEWHFADRLAHPELRSYLCRFAPSELVYTPDGKELQVIEPNGGRISLPLSGPTDGSVIDLIHQTPKAVASVPPGGFGEPCPTPDGKLLVLGTQPDDKKAPGRVEVWRTADGKRVGGWEVPNTFRILLLTATNEGRVVAGFEGGRVTAFEVGRAEPLWALDDLVVDPQRAALSPDGKWLVVNCRMDMALIDVDKGKVAARMGYANGRMESSAFAPDGGRFVVGTNAGELHWYKRGEKAPERESKANAGGVTGVAFSPDGKRVAGGGRDGTVRVWATATGQEEAVFRGHACGIPVLRFSPDGRELATCDIAGQCYRWPVGRPNPTVAPLSLPADLTGFVRASPDLTRVFATRWERNAVGTLCAADGRGRLPVAPQKGSAILRFEFQPGGSGFACGNGWGEVHHWASPAGPPVVVADHEMTMRVVQFSGDGRLLLSASERRVCVWDTVAKKEVLRLENAGRDAAVSPDGKRVAVADGTRYKVIDLATNKTAEWEGVSSVGVVRFTPDSAGLLVGQLMWPVVRYTLTADGKPVGPPRNYLGHSSAVRSLAVSRDGTRLAAGGEDGVVKVWDAESGQEVLGLTVPQRKAVEHLFFAADGRLVAGTEDGPPVVFDGRPRATR